MNPYHNYIFQLEEFNLDSQREEQIQNNRNT